jgi:hypothetical protein
LEGGKKNGRMHIRCKVSCRFHQTSCACVTSRGAASKSIIELQAHHQEWQVAVGIVGTFILIRLFVVGNLKGTKKEAPTKPIATTKPAATTKQTAPTKSNATTNPAGTVKPTTTAKPSATAKATAPQDNTKKVPVPPSATKPKVSLNLDQYAFSILPSNSSFECYELTSILELMNWVRIISRFHLKVSFASLPFDIEQSLLISSSTVAFWRTHHPGAEIPEYFDDHDKPPAMLPRYEDVIPQRDHDDYSHYPPGMALPHYLRKDMDFIGDAQVNPFPINAVIRRSNVKPPELENINADIPVPFSKPKGNTVCNIWMK